MYTYKVCLVPNNKQRTRFFRTMNKVIEAEQIAYDYIDNFLKIHKHLPKESEVRKYFTVQKKIYDEKQIEASKGMTNKEKRLNHVDTLFYDVSNDALKQGVKDIYNSFFRMLKHQSKHPVRKNFKDKKRSFYVDTDKIEFTNKKVKLEKISISTKSNRRVLNWIKLGEKDRIPTNCKYYNPRVVYEDKKFWLTVGVDDEFRPIKKKKSLEYKDESIGIDMNINHIDLSNGKVYETSNASLKIKKLITKKKRMQRALSRKYLVAKNKKKPLRESKNYCKLKEKIYKVTKRISHLQKDLNDKIIDDILKEPPKRIVIETLDVKEMQKNKRISSSLQITGFRKFLTLLKQRIRYLDIELVEVPKYYPSSKRCSNCGHIKEKLSLSERTYRCPCCGLVIGRDLNAALNLKNYIA